MSRPGRTSTGRGRERSILWPAPPAVADLWRDRLAQVPDLPGVYVVLRDIDALPVLVERGTGSWFKGRDPNVPVAVLAAGWLPVRPSSTSAGQSIEARVLPSGRLSFDMARSGRGHADRPSVELACEKERQRERRRGPRDRRLRGWEIKRRPAGDLNPNLPLHQRTTAGVVVRSWRETLYR